MKTEENNPGDPNNYDWLYRYTPTEWIRASLTELSKARSGAAQRDAVGLLAGCRRAAGVAINGMLALERPPDPRFGRTYMEHLAGLAADDQAPSEARTAAEKLLHEPLPTNGPVVFLRTSKRDDAMLDAAHTVMAHAYAMVLRAQ